MSPYRQIAVQDACPPLDPIPPQDPAEEVLDKLFRCPDPVVRLSWDACRLLFRRYHMFFEHLPMASVSFDVFGRTVLVEPPFKASNSDG